MDTPPKWAENLWKWADKNDISNEQLPREFEELIKVTSIDLRDSNFTFLPDELGKLTKLERLYLDNKLISISDKLARKLISTSMYILKYASKKLQNDKEVVLKAVESAS